jgi:AraC-like DNA-binding protein
MPRAAIAPLVRHAEDAIMRPIPRESEALRLLNDYVALLQNSDVLQEAALRTLVAGHIHDLVAATIGATRDAMEAARGGGIRAARLATIRADVLANLSDVHLSAKTVGLRHGVSDRYVHLLFAETGQTFSRFVEEQRLQRAFALLTHPTRAIPRIGLIAAAVGFAEHSTFDRAFRRRFGDTPSGVRRSRANQEVDSMRDEIS